MQWRASGSTGPACTSASAVRELRSQRSPSPCLLISTDTTSHTHTNTSPPGFPRRNFLHAKQSDLVVSPTPPQSLWDSVTHMHRRGPTFVAVFAVDNHFIGSVGSRQAGAGSTPDVLPWYGRFRKFKVLPCFLPRPCTRKSGFITQGVEQVQGLLFWRVPPLSCPGEVCGTPPLVHPTRVSRHWEWKLPSIRSLKCHYFCHHVSVIQPSQAISK